MSAGQLAEPVDRRPVPVPYQRISTPVLGAPPCANAVSDWYVGVAVDWMLRSRVMLVKSAIGCSWLKVSGSRSYSGRADEGEEPAGVPPGRLPDGGTPYGAGGAG